MIIDTPLATLTLSYTQTYPFTHTRTHTHTQSHTYFLIHIDIRIDTPFHTHTHTQSLSCTQALIYHLDKHPSTHSLSLTHTHSLPPMISRPIVNVKLVLLHSAKFFVYMKLSFCVKQSKTLFFILNLSKHLNIR